MKYENKRFHHHPKYLLENVDTEILSNCKNVYQRLRDTHERLLNSQSVNVWYRLRINSVSEILRLFGGPQLRFA